MCVRYGDSNARMLFCTMSLEVVLVSYALTLNMLFTKKSKL